MVQVIIDSNMSRKLTEHGQIVELRDPSGRLVGQFLPLLDPSEWEAVTAEPSPEELQVREQEAESYTTAEFVGQLGKLSCSESAGKHRP